MDTTGDLNILFVCKKNADASRVAEAYYNKFVSSYFSTTAVIGTDTIKSWEPLSPQVLQIMKEREIYIPSKEISPLTEKMVADADRVILFCEREDCPDFLLKHKSVCRWQVEDMLNVSGEKLCSIIDDIKIKTYDLLRVY